jgi:RNA polymerase sigma-70 factor (ECF subfamily)
MSRRTFKPAAAPAATAHANPHGSTPPPISPVPGAVATGAPPDGMMSRGARLPQSAAVPAPVDPPIAAPATPAAAPELELAGEVRRLVLAGRAGEARELYGDVVARHQRRAWRLACYYLRDTAEADEAVQDAFVKAFSHLPTYDPGRSFEVWLTRILVNSCLDRVKARKRRLRWVVGLSDAGPGFEPPAAPVARDAQASQETVVLRRERARALLTAVRQLPNRQRTVIMLSHFDGRSTREVSEMTGLSESTVRVHLFRGLRRLRGLVTRS